MLAEVAMSSLAPHVTLGENLSAVCVNVHAAPEEDIRGHLGEKYSVIYAVLSQIWMLGLTDTWMTPQKQYGSIFYNVWRIGHQILKLYWIWVWTIPITNRK